MIYKAKIRKFALYRNDTKPYLTMAEVKAKTGCDVICNGFMYDMTTIRPVCNIKLCGEVLAKDPYDYYGYAWNDGELPVFTNDMSQRDNFISCTQLIKDGKAMDLYYPAAMGGSRGRTALGFAQGGEMVLWCAAERQDDKTIEQVQNIMLAAGCRSAVNFDGGGSSECITPDFTAATARTVYNFICVWLEPEKFWKVQVGAFRSKDNAYALRDRLRAGGYGGAFVTYD